MSKHGQPTSRPPSGDKLANMATETPIKVDGAKVVSAGLSGDDPTPVEPDNTPATPQPTSPQAVTEATESAKRVSDAQNRKAKADKAFTSARSALNGHDSDSDEWLEAYAKVAEAQGEFKRAMADLTTATRDTIRPYLLEGFESLIAGLPAGVSASNVTYLAATEEASALILIDDEVSIHGKRKSGSGSAMWKHTDGHTEPASKVYGDTWPDGSYLPGTVAKNAWGRVIEAAHKAGHLKEWSAVEAPAAS